MGTSRLFWGLIFLIYAPVQFVYAQEAIDLIGKGDIERIGQVENGEVPPPDNVTTLMLHDACSRYKDSKFQDSSRETLSQRSSCLAYFFGIGSSLLYLDFEGYDIGICMPETSNTDDMIDLFYQKVAEDPMVYVDTIAIFSLMDMLKKAYPCNPIVPFE